MQKVRYSKMGNATSNIIIIVILVVIIFIAIKYSIPHFKGEGSCCGGGSSVKKVKPKKMGKVVATWKIEIEGMMCDNCEKRIHNALNSIDGVNAKVERSRNRAVLKMDKEIDESLIRDTITGLGYTVLGIEKEA